jgi:type I restriction enzyme M protein
MALKKSALYSSLWKSCDELRGSMDASQYKNYVLVLLFVKYVTDKYAGQGANALLKVPAGGSFHDMVAAMGQKDIGDRLNKIITKLAEANDLNGVINVPEADFNDDNKLGAGQEMVDRLTELVAIFNKPELDFTRNRADGDDLLGDAYEYLMRHFATESGKSKGQFYTPSEVSRVIAKIVGIDRHTQAQQSIYDPTCGSGSLLLKAADEALPTRISIYGQEMDNSTYALARMNMILHGHEAAELVKGNTLATPATWDAPGPNQLKQHDFVVANPPFSTKSWMNGLTPDADPYHRFTGYGVPPAKNGDYAFLLHIVASLKAHGKGVVVLPHGVLFRGNAEAVIRRKLVQRGYLRGIIGLPANLFYGTGIPACLLLLDKEGAATRDHIFMIDASRGYVKDGNKNRLREQDQHRIVDAWRRQADEQHFARRVPLTEIERNDYNLNLPRYVEGDIEAHLRGGLPAADLDALAAYWDVYPSLRQVLTAPAERPGYYRLQVAPEAIRPTIFEHPEFRAFSTQVEETFAAWVERAEPQLRAIDEATKPKELLETLSEDLLATFRPVHLLDGYDVYQRLMNYWNTTLQDDVYHVAAEGWDARPYRPLIGKKQRPGQWTSDVVPRELLIDRYLGAEQLAVAAATEAAAEATRRREELEEEYTAEEGPLSELEYANLTQLAAAVKARLRALGKAPKGDEPAPKRGRKAKAEVLDLFSPAAPRPDASRVSVGASPLFEQGVGEAALLLVAEPAVALEAAPPEGDPSAAERAALLALAEALAHEAAAKKDLADAQTHLEAQIGPTYLRLTPEATSDLLVVYKWLATLHHAVAQELTRLSQALARRLDELAARYQQPLPRQEAAVADLARQVHAHLQAMGFSWN